MFSLTWLSVIAVKGDFPVRAASELENRSSGPGRVAQGLDFELWVPDLPLEGGAFDFILRGCRAPRALTQLEPKAPPFKTGSTWHPQSRNPNQNAGS
jgi:hypothetical protein